MRKSRFALRLLLDFLVCALLIWADRYTKNLAVINLKRQPSNIIIPGVFQLTYLENTGAAFGMLKDQKFLFITIAVLMLIAIIYVLVKLPPQPKYTMINICLVLIAAGAVGNMIDRILYNYVVDFFYFILINFPIFNMADIYVTVACVLLIISVLFYYKESDFEFLVSQKAKDGEKPEGSK